MKTSILLCLEVFCIIFFLPINSYAQFTPATVTEYNFGLTVNGRATGNYILDKSMDVWEVTVWEDPYYNSPGLGFRMFPNGGGSYIGTVPLYYNDAEDPDVALTVDPYGDVHALVVYYSDAQDEYIIEDFIWSATAFTPNGGPVVIDYRSTFGTSINIDADYDGYFIVVWDVSAAPFAMTGDVTSGALSLNTAVGIGSTGGNGTDPDVCMSNHSNDKVFYCFLYSGSLYIEEDSYSYLSIGSATGNNPLISPSNNNGSFYTPRIACPNPNVGNSNDWTVVVLDTDNSTDYKVVGFNYNTGNGFSGSILYNDGSNITPDLTVNLSYGPVVSYDDMSHIFIGWNTDLSGFLPITYGNSAQAIYPLVVLCDYNGNPQVISYFEVPDNIITAEIKDYLSLAGKNGLDVVLCSFYDNTASDVDTKSVYTSINIPGLKLNTGIDSSILDSKPINHFDSKPIIAIIYDCLGEVVRFQRLMPNELFPWTNTQMFANGIIQDRIYLLEVKSESGEIILRSKILK